jgi:predicted CopG family antitoxin
VNGLSSKVQNPHGPTARGVCKYLLDIATKNATKEEKTYLQLVKKRIDNGSLSDIIKRDIEKKLQHTDLMEAIVGVYSTLIKCLVTNQPYF